MREYGVPGIKVNLDINRLAGGSVDANLLPGFFGSASALACQRVEMGCRDRTANRSGPSG
jgi:hypothetical protein